MAAIESGIILEDSFDSLGPLIDVTELMSQSLNNSTTAAHSLDNTKLDNENSDAITTTANNDDGEGNIIELHVDDNDVESNTVMQSNEVNIDTSLVAVVEGGDIEQFELDEHILDDEVRNFFF